MASKRIGLYWFTNDLRLHDQPSLCFASKQVDELICVYVWDEDWFVPSRFADRRLGLHRQRFLRDSLQQLQRELNSLAQNLIELVGRPSDVLTQVIEQHQVSDVFRSQNVGWYENRTWDTLQTTHLDVRFHSTDSHTLFEQPQLPFTLDQLPATFTQFRKRVENIDIPAAINRIDWLPPQPSGCLTTSDSAASLHLLAEGESVQPQIKGQHVAQFKGGERRGLEHLNTYFSAPAASRYKQVRNELQGWTNSTKFSPWLADGSLSVRTVLHRLRDYEDLKGANDSTYWIFFELLWREFFQWYAHKHGAKLYRFKGLNTRQPLTSFYPERFRKWASGTTPFPLVNACMNELRVTGYLSNRGRQIVASCLVNELAIDWRYGASHFEMMLIDYDPASNWGNWQYLAGVGADVKDKRHFNLEKQTQLFDPEGDYVSRWATANAKALPLDSVDIADWPVTESDATISSAD